MRVNRIKFTHNQESYDFYYPINGKRQTRGFKNILTGKTYPLIKKNPKLILDVGANLGSTSMFFAINYPKAKIFSFEPTEMNFIWLQKNTEIFQNVTRIKKGAYFKDTTAKIYLDSESGGRNSIHKEWARSERYETVELINLGKFLETNNLIEKIDILKIDTEGCEVDILSSIETFLENIDVIYLEYHGKDDEEVILEILSKSHIVMQKKANAEVPRQVSSELIGSLCLADVTVNGKIILRAGKKITETDIQELQTSSVQTVKVLSDYLGEIVFLNKNIFTTN